MMTTLENVLELSRTYSTNLRQSERYSHRRYGENFVVIIMIILLLLIFK